MKHEEITVKIKPTTRIFYALFHLLPSAFLANSKPELMAELAKETMGKKHDLPVQALEGRVRPSSAGTIQKADMINNTGKQVVCDL